MGRGVYPLLLKFGKFEVVCSSPSKTLQFSSESAVLEDSEKTFQFGERGAMRSFQCLHSGDVATEVAL
jgi:hypothetical protein